MTNEEKILIFAVSRGIRRHSLMRLKLAKSEADAKLCEIAWGSHDAPEV